MNKIKLIFLNIYLFIINGKNYKLIEQSYPERATPLADEELESQILDLV